MSVGQDPQASSRLGAASGRATGRDRSAGRGRGDGVRTRAIVWRGAVVAVAVRPAGPPASVRRAATAGPAAEPELGSRDRLPVARPDPAGRPAGGKILFF